jgi:hypothetical protein
VEEKTLTTGEKQISIRNQTQMLRYRQRSMGSRGREATVMAFMRRLRVVREWAQKTEWGYPNLGRDTDQRELWEVKRGPGPRHNPAIMNVRESHGGAR